jgi:hypothetical protein
MLVAGKYFEHAFGSALAAAFFAGTVVIAGRLAVGK